MNWRELFRSLSPRQAVRLFFDSSYYMSINLGVTLKLPLLYALSMLFVMCMCSPISVILLFGLWHLLFFSLMNNLMRICDLLAYYWKLRKFIFTIYYAN